MNAAQPADGGHGALAGQDGPTLVDQRLVEPPAQELELDHPLGRDEADHGADLVHVRGQHDARAAGGAVQHSDDRAEAVG